MVKALINITLCVSKQDLGNRPRKMPRFDIDIHFFDIFKNTESGQTEA